jgi:hypothetical protein
MKSYMWLFCGLWYNDTPLRGLSPDRVKNFQFSISSRQSLGLIQPPIKRDITFIFFSGKKGEVPVFNQLGTAPRGQLDI